MSHIPDGTLHAWLDGAAGFDSAAEEESFHTHLGVCEDCRARLEEARRLREDAQMILGDSGPAAIDQPAFEELQARADVRVKRERAGDSNAEVEARVSRAVRPHAAVRESDRSAAAGPGHRPWFARRIPLAWAASIVMAMGAGWFGNRILEESPVQATRQVAQSKLAESPESAEPGVSVLKEDAFGDHAARNVTRGAAAGNGPEPVGNFRDEDLAVQSEAALRQYAAGPEEQERAGDYQAPDQTPDQAQDQPARSLDNLQTGRGADRDARRREVSQDGEAFALDARLEKRADDVSDVVTGNRPQAEEAPAIIAQQVPVGGAAAPAQDPAARGQNEERDNRNAGLSREAVAPAAAEPKVTGEAGQGELRDRLAEPSDENGIVAANASKSRAEADGAAEPLVVGGQADAAGDEAGAVSDEAGAGSDEAGAGFGQGDGKELATCFALTTSGWTPPFELPSTLDRPQEGEGEQDGASVTWTMLADNAVRIRWRSGDQTMILTARRVSGGVLEGSAAVWLESGTELASRGLVRLTPASCP